MCIRTLLSYGFYVIMVTTGVFACDDPVTTIDGTNQQNVYPPVAGMATSPTAGMGQYPTAGYPTAGMTTGTAGMSISPAGMAISPAGMESPVFMPPPNAIRCEFREQCDPGQYCYMEYCVDQQPCGEFATNVNCPQGYACVGGLCFEDGGEGSCLSVSPTQINFGEVARGDLATQEITLSACGSAPVTVTQVAISAGTSDTFSVIPGGIPVSLNPGESSIVSVGYSPRMVGMETGSVIIESTDFNQPSQTVNLNATAVPPALNDTGLHVRLEWDTNQTDVDLHLLGPGATTIWDCNFDCNFANPNPSWGDPQSDLDNPYLDLDDVDGYGPENINIQEPTPGIYTVVVHYWNDHGGAPPGATVHALSYGEIVATVGPEELSSVGDVWYAFQIEFPGNRVQVLNRFDFSPPNVPSCK